MKSGHRPIGDIVCNVDCIDLYNPNVKRTPNGPKPGSVLGNIHSVSSVSKKTQSDKVVTKMAKLKATEGALDWARFIMRASTSPKRNVIIRNEIMFKTGVEITWLIKVWHSKNEVVQAWKNIKYEIIFI